MSRREITQQKPKREWIDIINPDELDHDFLESISKFHRADITDSLTDTLRSKLIHRKGYFFLSIMIPFYDKEKRQMDISEIDFFVEKNRIITIHSEQLTIIDELMNRLEHDALFNKLVMKKNISSLLFQIIDDVLDHSYSLIDALSHELRELRADVFAGDQTKEMISVTLRMRHNIAIMRKAARGHLTVLQRLSHTDGYSEFIELTDYAAEVWEDLESDKEMVEALEDANETIAQHSLNDVMKTLTILSVVLLPSAVLAGVFGMNAKNVPFVGHPFDFWLMVLTMTSLTFFMLAIFWRKHWLK